MLAVSLGAALSLDGQSASGAEDAQSEPVDDAGAAASGESILALARAALAALAPLAEPCQALEDVIARGGNRIAVAYEPFRLGIVGDARAGKSSLINCFAGEQLAFTDVIEATPVTCMFRHGARAAQRFATAMGGSRA